MRGQHVTPASVLRHRKARPASAFGQMGSFLPADVIPDGLRGVGPMMAFTITLVSRASYPNSMSPGEDRLPRLVAQNHISTHWTIGGQVD